ncbi:zinc-binding alcohol dehydrogenase family protein [Mycobacterium sp. KBS0706]|uniref:zinc-binding alcohol dehydrogenase family protein n=1 Tax=Mycobacterium sp. KBS0706 TaxID=2578109 RepID=UPI00110F9D8D|nr:zinc-binding alcohol dehydrogenase family protein [Mycobacterium sp. KBS0706]TSD84310.1 zinc-binding alcohol dehydrogenase family protein [Mycobacterium sp. KBS0706]
MRAVVCQAPGELVLEDRPEPERGDGEVLVRVRRMGICGTDFHIYEGSHPYLQYPRIMGHELSGEVLEAPEGSLLESGDTVIVNPYVSCGACIACRAGKPNCCVRIAVLGVHRDGGMCERIAVPEHNLYPAGSLTLDQGASIEFLAIGAHAVARSGLGPGARALVIGAGPIGLGVAIFAGLAGGDVSIMDREADRLAFALESGIAARVIGVGSGAAELVLQATDGDGFDVVFDATGSRASMESAFGHVAHGGTLVLVSVVTETIAFSDPEFHKREMTVLGSRNALRADFERVVAAIEGGRVPLQHLLTHRTSLAGAVADLPHWAIWKDGLVKALVEIG